MLNKSNLNYVQVPKLVLHPVPQYAVVFPQYPYFEQQLPKLEFKHVMPLPQEPSVLVLSAVDVLDLR
jgi:hypothetical protein